MSTKHTPGPWVVIATEKQNLGEYAQIGQVGAFSDIVGRVCVSHKANRTLNESGQANARLIAAAPELLEALKDCRRALELANAIGELAVVDAAIAKATGEQA